MNLVLVYLREVKEHVIVPETYINGFDGTFLNSLKNNGNNPGRDLLIFWSKDCIEGKIYPEPDKNAGISKTFPPEDGAWYKGRTIYYTGESNSFHYTAHNQN